MDDTSFGPEQSLSEQNLVFDDNVFDRFTRADVAMIITNPNLDDNPIVYVNEAFTRSTGFARSASIGRNCRFLQGEQTDKESVDRMRASIDAEEPITLDVLNYKANGAPFNNRIIIAPIKDASGKTEYFIAFQKEVTAVDLEAEKGPVNEQLMEVQNRGLTAITMIVGKIRRQSAAISVP